MKRFIGWFLDIDLLPIWFSIVFAGLLIWFVISGYKSSIRRSIVLIDGCEYIQVSNGSRVPLVHKGDCSNVIHRPTIE